MAGNCQGKTFWKSYFLLFFTLGIILFKTVESRSIIKSDKCPPRCSCTRDTAFCVNAESIPKSLPVGIISLTFVNATFRNIKENAFAHLPFLQFLLLNSNTFTVIEDDAFWGLTHLQYLFIENNNIASFARNAFRGLRSLTHLSLANNNLKSLPSRLFKPLNLLHDVDLRGNIFHCDCQIKWLVEWLRRTNLSIPAIYCITPLSLQNQKIGDLSDKDFSCITTDFALYQTLPFQSISAEVYTFNEDLYVVFAQPNTGCSFLKWDYVESVFSKYQSISARSAVYCKPIIVQNQLIVVVAQLFGGSFIYKWDSNTQRFLKFQDIDVSKIRKPNDIEAFQIDKDWYFIIADSSKAGSTSLYHWDRNGFYSHQSLHPWHRDTDVEYVEINNRHRLILSSSSQAPVIYQWNGSRKQFIEQSEIAGMMDVQMVKHFQHHRDTFLLLTRFIGDSKVLRWEGSHFTAIQTLPARGCMVLQPFRFDHRQYMVLGSDLSFTQIYTWNTELKLFLPFQELNIPAPRMFRQVSEGNKDLLLVSSFKGNTLVYLHLVVDLSA
ncbi:leucine-rich repeat LGI family member 3 [Protopterus annectens]|uniref:leucine-rich repeat LGI family member 3 n=1 Tax=Protopterus annectens TaxID=7888 RepID=UPI001CFAB6BD|nr:leucine-rich repeat LGI family member 3 [Protopterus annectens]